MKKLHRIIKFKPKAWLESYININANLRKKKQKLIFENIFLNWWIMQLSKKIWNMCKNIEKLKLSKHKEEQTIWCQNQVIILQSFYQKL